MQNFGNIGIVGGGSAVVVVNTSTTVNTAEPTKVHVHTENKSQGIASWGSNNDFPQKLLKEVRKNGAATSGLSLVKDSIYGRGFILFQEVAEENKNGEEKRKLVKTSLRQFPKINSFFKASQMKRFFKDSITDLTYFAIAFPEYILSNDGNSIARVYRQKAAHCRFELMEEKTGFIKNVWVSTKWADGVDLDSDYAKKIPLIDSYWSAEEVKEYCKANKIKSFVRPMFYTMLDESYYPVASWHSAYYSKWIHVANSIPEFKKALFENQVNIKYHIEVDEDYFKSKYKGSDKEWSDFTLEERATTTKQFVEFIDKYLRGSENAGKSIWSMIYKDDHGKPFPGVKITAIDDKLKDGSFLPDGEAANSETLFAISVDPTLIGAGIPGGMTAGGGSDKRVAWTIQCARAKPKRETVLESFEFIQQYNNWDAEIDGAFEDTQLTTLDKNPTGTQKAANV
ncbi:hypothetical protein SAMN04489761_3071 [Tenacibaculum sp. MAR_2009_124]|uniref:hypothetical protein n=1 Tax=Tenacibaculum sp. MAR_2009_124 TaxID=1250059 RepID=UPI000899FB7B|nr:hypothetical protein [Tenacibaculum sp. MAR_2009_124]SEC46615.1 hypothetical protein SAMN04489761_3071 [Tenacibaculum sp. MAR_2009_124]